MKKNEARQKISKTLEILNDFYGRLELKPRRELFRELISSMLSHRTNHANEEKAYFNMLDNYHIHLLWHGQRICVWRKPKCEKCPLTRICNYFQEVVKPDLKI